VGIEAPDRIRIVALVENRLDHPHFIRTLEHMSVRTQSAIQGSPVVPPSGLSFLSPVTGAGSRLTAVAMA
jgi:hypothetical protein